LKRTLSILIIFVFVFNFGGFYLIIKAKQYAIRKEVKRKIKRGVPDNELIPILVNHKNEAKLDWKHSKEFRYNGEMYDIVQQEKNTDGSITYYCIWDSLESEVFNDLDKLAAKETDKQNRGIIELLKTNHLFIQTSHNKYDAEITIDLYALNTMYSNKRIMAVYLEIDNPPPEVSFI
jgi:diacylglycerol kinase family enzyme